MIAKDLIGSAMKNLFNILEDINTSIINKDNSKITFLENDLNGIKKDMKLEKDGSVYKAIQEHTTFFNYKKLIAETKTLQAKIESLSSRLSDKQLFFKTCLLGIQIMKDNFQNTNDIETFNKNYAECIYFKDRFLDTCK